MSLMDVNSVFNIHTCIQLVVDIDVVLNYLYVKTTLVMQKTSVQMLNFKM